MVTTRRKKVTKYRAHTTHGGGHRKKRRGAGSRGGRGRAGSGKRAGQKVAGGVRFTGRKGFRPRRSQKSVTTLNLSDLTTKKLDAWVAKGLATKNGDMVTVDLAKVGVRKLLGSGTVTAKVTVQVEMYSKRAAEKLAEAGGKILEESAAPAESA